MTGASTVEHAALHCADFARALVVRSRKGAAGASVTVLIMAPRPGGGVAYGTKSLSHPPTARMLVDYLYACLPAGSTLSLHPRRGLQEAALDVIRRAETPKLSLVRSVSRFGASSGKLDR